MQKIALFPYQDSAVGFYRILQPGRVMKREGLVKDARSIPFSGEHQSQFYEYQDKTYLEMTQNADVMWSTIVYKPEMITKFLNLRKYNINKTIFDMDDNFYAIPSDNPASKDAEPLRKNFEACLRSADGVTVSTPVLKNIYGAINPNIFIIKNALDFKIWDKIKIKQNTKKKLRIGWRGAFGHKDDLELIKGALEAVLKDFNVELVMLGWEGYQLKHPIEKHGWVSLFEYPDKLASLNLDMAVVPIVDSAYNRCKSNLAYLEFSAIKVPVVLSPVENQKGMVATEAQSNYEWYQALESLINDKSKRLYQGQKAYDFVHKNYDERDFVRPLHDWMDKLPRRKDLEPDKQV